MPLYDIACFKHTHNVFAPVVHLIYTNTLNSYIYIYLSYTEELYLLNGGKNVTFGDLLRMSDILKIEENYAIHKVR